jgi:hypothetical protein
MLRSASDASQGAFDAAVGAHADVIYTGYPSGGHVIWEGAYDDPRLAPWVYSRHRLVRDGIQISSPTGYPTWSGLQTVDWLVAEPSETGELWFSADDGLNWALIDSAVTNDGVADLNTQDLPDAAFARARLVFYDADGFVHRREESEPFVIDNPGNGEPFVRINQRMFRHEFLPSSGMDSFIDRVIEEDVIDVMAVAGDPEGGPLEASIYYSIDGGQVFTLVGSQTIERSASPHRVPVRLADLPNTRRAVIRIEVSDGELTAYDQTVEFAKISPRESTTYVEHTVGDGVAEVHVNWIDPGALTGHRYRISFNDVPLAATAYTVSDLETSQVVLDSVPTSDGVVESPLFDGIRLIVSVPERAQVNLDSTGWSIGTSDMDVAISAPPVNTPDGRVQLLASPFDYVVTVFEEVVDTSSTEFGFPAVEMRFSVVNTLTGRSDILFADLDEDGRPTPGDFFYIIEPDPVSGDPALSWFFQFRGTETTSLPSAGDIFVFRTIKPATGLDVFEFEAVVGLRSERRELPAGIDLLRNFPNPFSHTTTIEYGLLDHSNVDIEVYDILGRRVSRLDGGLRAPGRHAATWGPASSDAERLAPGVYFYRLKVTNALTGVETSAARRMTLIR